MRNTDVHSSHLKKKNGKRGDEIEEWGWRIETERDWGEEKKKGKKGGRREKEREEGWERKEMEETYSEETGFYAISTSDIIRAVDRPGKK